MAYTTLVPILLAVTALLWSFLRLRYRRGLCNLPGPFWASILPVHRVTKLWRGQAHREDIELHRKYGNIVRVGPNHVMVRGAQDVSTVYSIGGKFTKGEFYRPMDFKTPAGVRETIMSVHDEEKHRALKRPIAAAYSMSTMVELESKVDQCVRIIQRSLDARLQQELDLGMWLTCFGFDVITSVTLSDRMGFLEKGHDSDNILAAIDVRFRYCSVVGQFLPLHWILLGSKMGSYISQFVPALSNAANARFMVAFAGKKLERYKTQGADQKEHKDLLDRFKRSRDGVELISDDDLLTYTTTNLLAGSDTTASCLRALFWYLHHHARVRDRLVAEIDEQHAKGNLSDPITFSQSLEMPYWQACLKEALRIHPPAGFMLERVVPDAGTTLSGTFLPSGTIVGANPWAVARDPLIFGSDADVFRPERWLESPPEQLRRMDRHSLVFGGGSRPCIGKNIALMEINKLVPHILRRYNVEIVHPERYREVSMVTVKQFGLFCRLSMREGQA